MVLIRIRERERELCGKRSNLSDQSTVSNTTKGAQCAWIAFVKLYLVERASARSAVWRTVQCAIPPVAAAVAVPMARR